MFDLYAINRVATLPGNLEKHEKPEILQYRQKSWKLSKFENFENNLKL